MSKGMLVFMLGLLITFGGAGGVETSLNTLMLVGSFLVSLGGCCLMFVGLVVLRMENPS